MNLDKVSDELREIKLNAMKKINMERNRVERVFEDIEKELEEFKERHKKDIN